METSRKIFCWVIYDETFHKSGGIKKCLDLIQNNWKYSTHIIMKNKSNSEVQNENIGNKKDYSNSLHNFHNSFENIEPPYYFTFTSWSIKQ